MQDYITNTLKAIKSTGDGQIAVNVVTDESPLLKIIPMNKTNDGSSHRYGKIIDIKDSAERTYGGGYVEGGDTRQAEAMTLAKSGFTISFNKDEIEAIQRTSGEQGVIERFKQLIAQHGVNEASVVDNKFIKQLGAYAKSNHKTKIGSRDIGATLFDAGGTVAGKQSKITIVKWTPNDPSGVTGLYSSKSNINKLGEHVQTIFNITPVAEGGYVETGKDADNNPTFGKKFIVDYEFGLLINNPLNVTQIVNVEVGNSSVDINLIDEALTQVGRGQTSNVLTTIITHPLIANTVFNGLKEKALRMENVDKMYDKKINMFDEAIIVKDYQVAINGNKETVS